MRGQMITSRERQHPPRPAVLQASGGKHLHRDSFGRFAADSKTGDNTSLGWNDFMTMASFTDPEQVGTPVVVSQEGLFTHRRPL